MHIPCSHLPGIDIKAEQVLAPRYGLDGRTSGTSVFHELVV